MRKIIFGEDCPLTRYLEEVSMLESSHKAQYAGFLLGGLGFLSFPRQRPDISFTAELFRGIAKTKQTDLISEATENCVQCPQLNGCEVGALITDG